MAKLTKQAEQAALLLLNIVNANGDALVELPTPDGRGCVVTSTTAEETEALRAFVQQRADRAKGGA